MTQQTTHLFKRYLPISATSDFRLATDMWGTNGQPDVKGKNISTAFYKQQHQVLRMEQKKSNILNALSGLTKMGISAVTTNATMEKVLDSITKVLYTNVRLILAWTRCLVSKRWRGQHDSSFNTKKIVFCILGHHFNCCIQEIRFDI